MENIPLVLNNMKPTTNPQRCPLQEIFKPDIFSFQFVHENQFVKNNSNNIKDNTIDQN